jgi:hypothetical protein
MSAVQCYLRHSVLPVEEDLTHEFKAHRQLSNIDLSTCKYTRSIDGGLWPKLPMRRASLSLSIGGMLNTGLGGIMYLGVTDEGVAEGFIMSLYQKDHFTLSFRDLLSRYIPPVPDHMVSIDFVPVIDPDEEGKPISPDPVDLDTPRWQDHEVRESRYCWCDSYTLALCANGLIPRFYVLEIKFEAWNKDDPRNATLIRPDVWDGRPLFVNECGKMALRRCGLTVKVRKHQMEALKANKMSPRDEDFLDLSEFQSDENDSEDEFYSYESSD